MREGNKIEKFQNSTPPQFFCNCFAQNVGRESDLSKGKRGHRASMAVKSMQSYCNGHYYDFLLHTWHDLQSELRAQTGC